MITYAPSIATTGIIACINVIVVANHVLSFTIGMITSSNRLNAYKTIAKVTSAVKPFCAAPLTPPLLLP